MDDARSWHRLASGLARRLNLGRWLARTLPLWACTSAVAACCLVFLRRHGSTALLFFWALAIAAWVVVGIVQWWRFRRTRLTNVEALVWLEDALHLNNRLSAARSGVGAWPPLDARTRDLLRWRPARIAPVLLFPLMLVLAAALVPVTPPAESTPGPVQAPLAWSEVERWLDEIRETELVTEEAVDAWEEKLDSLRRQPKDAWYRHASLEAGDSLKEDLATELRALDRGLSSAEDSLGEMLALDETASPEARRLARRGIGESLEELELTALPLDRKLKRKLETLARQPKLRRLTKEELETLRERLRECRYHDLPRAQDEAYAFLTPGGDPGSGGAGKGGVTRGPGNAPIDLSGKRTELETSRIENVVGRRPLGIELGDSVGVGVGEHDVDTSGFRYDVEAGAIVSAGEGGGVVWDQRWTPRERQVLKRYFK